MFCPSPEIRQLVEAFEDAWAASTPQAPGHVFAKAANLNPPADADSRLWLLIRVVALDLEYRWRAARRAGKEGPLVEDYAEVLSELGDPQDWPDELLLAEYRARRDAGDEPDHARFLARFPDRRRSLSLELREIDNKAETGIADVTGGGPRPGVPDRPTVPGYEVLSLLGRGGMGVVYKARQTALNRVVALKMILTGRHTDRRVVNRFLAEAHAVARLQHPNIVQIYEVGEAGGLPYFSLEYCAGGSLDRQIGHEPQVPEAAARILEQLARAMHYAHEQGILHRDLKPANVLLDAAGEPKVSDFGLAKQLEEDAGMTSTGAILGTPAYMAPEQAAGQKEIGPAADIYALGATLYVLLTGRPPFTGATLADVLEAVRAREPVPPSQLVPRLDRDIDTICLKCLRKEPAQRYGSAAELAEDLQRYRRSEPIRARPVGYVERFRLWYRRNPRLAAVGTLAVAALVAVAVVSLVFWARSERDRYEIATKSKELEAERAKLSNTVDELGQTNTHLRETDREKELALARAQEEFNRANAETVRSSDAALRAAENATGSLARQLGAQAELVRGQRPELLQRSARLAALSLNLRPTVEADRALRLALDLMPRPVATMTHTNGRLSVTKETEQGEERGYAHLPELLLFSPEGNHLAALAGDSARVWDARTGREVVHICPTLTAVSFDATGGTVTAVGNSGATTWTPAAGRQIAAITFPHPARAVAYSPIGRRVASAESDGVVRVWDAETGDEVGSFRTARPARDVSFRPDGQVVAAADGYRVQVWHATGNKLLATLEHDGLVERIAWNAAGTHLATATTTAVQVWEIARPEPKVLARLSARLARACQDIAFSPDGRLLAAGGADGTRVWATADWELVRHIHQPTQALAFNKRGTHLALGGWKGFEVWATDPWSLAVDISWLRNRLGDFRAMRFSPDGDTIVIDGHSDVAQWSLSTGGASVTNYQACAHSPDGQFHVMMDPGRGVVRRTAAANRGGVRLLSPTPVDEVVHSIGFTPNGRFVAAKTGITERDRGFDTAGKFVDKKELVRESPDSPRVWDLTTGREVLGDDRLAWAKDVTFRTDEEPLVPTRKGSPVRVRADREAGREARVGDGTIRVSEVGATQPLRTLPDDGLITDVAFSPGGKLLAAAGESGAARVWDVKSGREVARLIHEDVVRAVAFSPDGRRVATTSADGSAWVWEVQGGAEVRRLRIDAAAQGHTLGLGDGGRYLRVLTSGARDRGDVVNVTSRRAAHVWDTQTWEQISLLPFDTERERLVFSPDGRYVAVVKNSGEILLKNARSGAEVATFNELRDQGEGFWVAFSPDATYLAVAYAERAGAAPGNPAGFVHVWEVANRQLVRRDRTRVAVQSGMFSPDGRYLACLCPSGGQKQGITFVWDLAGRAPAVELRHDDAATAIHFATRERLVVRTIAGLEYWDVRGRKRLDRLRLGRWVTGLGISPDGRFVAVAEGRRESGDREFVVWVWEPGSGRPAVPVPQEDQIGDIAFSPDGLHFATSAAGLKPWPNDFSARVWRIVKDPVANTRVVREVAQMPHPGPVTGVLFSTSGRYLFTGGGDGHVRVWAWRPEDIIAEAGRRLTRNLTPAEWARFMPPEHPYTKLFPDLP